MAGSCFMYFSLCKYIFFHIYAVFCRKNGVINASRLVPKRGLSGSEKYLRSSKNAFIMQSKSAFLEFLRGIHCYKFGSAQKFFRGEIIQGEWRNFHQARALYLTEVLTWVLVCFLVEFDLLIAFGVLSCRILDCASLFIYVHEHDRLCFPMLTEETAVFDRLHLLT